MCDFATVSKTEGKATLARMQTLDRAGKEALLNEVLETTDMDNLTLMRKINTRLEA